MIDWLNKVWIEYLKNYDNMLGSLLIMDKATTHYKDEFKSSYFNKDIRIYYIPVGLTSILQSLNTSINKPFKDALRNKHIQYCIKKGLNNNEKIF